MRSRRRSVRHTFCAGQLDELRPTAGEHRAAADADVFAKPGQRLVRPVLDLHDHPLLRRQADVQIHLRTEIGDELDWPRKAVVARLRRTMYLPLPRGPTRDLLATTLM